MAYPYMSDLMEKDPLFENIKDEQEFQRLVGIARDKVQLKRDEVRKLEESGVIPKSWMSLSCIKCTKVIHADNRY